MWLTGWLVAGPAFAIRPTEGGLFSFSPEDTIAVYDPPDPRIRVTYSAAGPNEVEPDDEDASGVPDHVENAAEIALEALDLFAVVGFTPPLTEADVGLTPLGGSPALDIYLVDFDRQADGQYGVDDCIEEPVLRCGGYLVVENDFYGYSYVSPRAGLEVVVPHELFHGVQYGYSGDLPVWIGEGTAVWAERVYDEDSGDFVRFANEYLLDVTRSIDNPPIGPVPSFAYGSGLWWDFLTLRHDETLMVELLEALPGAADPTQTMVDTIEARGDTIEAAWGGFATFNLATGTRSGEIAGYPYAERLRVIESTQAGLIADDNRFYPLATTYYRVNHRGGELFFGLGEAAPELSFAVHPTRDGDAYSPLLEAAVTFDGADPGPRSLGELPDGIYWLWGAQPRYAEDSVKVQVCVGDEAHVNDCLGLTAADTGGAEPNEEPEGCGCDAGSASRVGAAGIPGLWLGLLVVRRRRGAAR